MRTYTENYKKARHDSLNDRVFIKGVLEKQGVLKNMKMKGSSLDRHFTIRKMLESKEAK